MSQQLNLRGKCFVASLTNDAMMMINDVLSVVASRRETFVACAAEDVRMKLLPVLFEVGCSRKALRAVGAFHLR